MIFDGWQKIVHPQWTVLTGPDGHRRRRCGGGARSLGCSCSWPGSTVWYPLPDGLLGRCHGNRVYVDSRKPQRPGLPGGGSERCGLPALDGRAGTRWTRVRAGQGIRLVRPRVRGRWSEVAHVVHVSLAALPDAVATRAR
ncbi:hypothetical protein [Kibdelosporangium philippinense]|uniref:hypothetical protein n=1 Tax=Kibdelosporangium philippinense TaxID=211113 RepID=UPI0036129928